LTSSARETVCARLAELRLLRDGWLEGTGTAPAAAGLDWLTSKFAQAFPADLPLPFVYPTPEGGIRLEWSLGSQDCTVDVDLATRGARLHALNLSSDEEREDNLNLNEPADWARLVDQIQRIAPPGWLHRAESGA
jgi:hypothetical protein